MRNIIFSDVTIPSVIVEGRMRNEHKGTIPHSWTKVKVTSRIDDERIKKIKLWLSENIEMAWSTNNSFDYNRNLTIITIYFKSVDDALLFKLSEAYDTV